MRSLRSGSTVGAGRSGRSGGAIRSHGHLRWIQVVVVALFTMASLVLAAPGCGRASLEIEGSPEGGPPPKTCGPSTCPGGCCDASGQCRVGSDTRACGSAGNRCSDCVANGFEFCDGRKVCGRNVATCDAKECPSGCCSFEGGLPTCLAGTDATACGRSGDVCTDCASEGRSCDGFTRACGDEKCNPTNCAGCCVGDKCLTGSSDTACGASGQACTSCEDLGQTCAPQPGAGGACIGTPKCGPDNCAGCCNGNTCVAGVDAIACGAGGGACDNCTGKGQTCVPPGQPNAGTCQTAVTCGPDSCPGCCEGNDCVVATTPAECGKAGEGCFACNVNETCGGGLCVPQPKCSPANCPGCCIGADVCAVGNQNTACGIAGTQCVNCAGMGGQVCQGGACEVPVCGPDNCAGCCSGNTCVLGTQDSACGQAGAACNDCAAGDQICSGRVCKAKCGPATCAGCCTANNACALGFTNGACGSGGSACNNCSAAGSTCDTLVTPRVCVADQNECPAAYPTCPAGVTTPVTPSLENLCDDVADLDALQAACQGLGGLNSASCVAALQVLAITNPSCATCLKPFEQPFTSLKGIYACAAPFVSGACNRSTGCAVDCQDTSCTQCDPASETQCRNQVNGGGGQCNAYVAQTACVLGAVGPGSLCNPGTYGGSFGSWFRAVGDHFCGNGP